VSLLYDSKKSDIMKYTISVWTWFKNKT